MAEIIENLNRLCGNKKVEELFCEMFVPDFPRLLFTSEIQEEINSLDMDRFPLLVLKLCDEFKLINRGFIRGDDNEDFDSYIAPVKEEGQVYYISYVLPGFMEQRAPDGVHPDFEKTLVVVPECYLRKPIMLGLFLQQDLVDDYGAVVREIYRRHNRLCRYPFKIAQRVIPRKYKFKKLKD